jgi:hypothetical protein
MHYLSYNFAVRPLNFLQFHNRALCYTKLPSKIKRIAVWHLAVGGGGSPEFGGSGGGDGQGRGRGGPLVYLGARARRNLCGGTAGERRTGGRRRWPP